ncbi:MAG: glycerophosphodiester phosphodiesterase, partial [bacterium]|nr:glycerophosphodiester phosphodiesterase [bacterium]
MKKYIFISLATTITLATLIGCSTTIKNKAILKQVDLQGHRGARALRPENSIPAFISCIENNMTTIELDTAVTKDKKLIIIHDTVLNEKLCVDSTGKPAKAIPVANLTVAELKKYDCGSLQHEDFPEQVTVKNTRLITLEEFFNFIKEYERKSNAAGTIKFNIEIKFKESAAIAEVKEAAQIMVRSLQQSGMRERTVVQCFNLDLIKEIRKINPGLTTSALFTLTRVEGLLLLAG